MAKFQGTIIEESLSDKSVLDDIKITATRVSPVTEEEQTPWLKQWTLHTIEVPEQDAEKIAGKLSKALETQHEWYIDFKNADWHYIIFRDKVFKVNRSNKEEYEGVTKHGVSLGIPDYQLDFSPEIK